MPSLETSFFDRLTPFALGRTALPQFGRTDGVFGGGSPAAG